MVTEGGLELQKAENSVMVSSMVNLEDGFGCDQYLNQWTLSRLPSVLWVDLNQSVGGLNRTGGLASSRWLPHCRWWDIRVSQFRITAFSLCPWRTLTHTNFWISKMKTGVNIIHYSSFWILTSYLMVETKIIWCASVHRGNTEENYIWGEKGGISGPEWKQGVCPSLNVGWCDVSRLLVMQVCRNTCTSLWGNHTKQCTQK